MILFEQLTYGHVSKILMLAPLIPLIKDKLGDYCFSNKQSYLNKFDWVIIILYSDQLAFDDLQFSYQANSSTNKCTWMIVEQQIIPVDIYISI